jgi:type I restriction enzyme S subunit
MSFPRYPKYKSSRVEWLGDVPEGWDVVPFKHRCSRYALYGANISSDEYVPDGVRFLRTTDISENGELEPDGVFVSPEVAREYLLKDKDILISRSGTIGRAFVFAADVHPECAYAGYLVRFVPTKQLNSRLFFYFTKSAAFSDWLQTQLIFSTIGNVNGQKYAQCRLALPPLPEQTAIAEFLDRETGKIDGLVAEQRRLMELLKEKRQAVISHAVTKGLNPHAPMKPSGIEWLGDVPEHWEVKPLRHLGRCQNGLNIGGEAFGSGFPFVSYGDVYKNTVLPAAVQGLVQSSEMDWVSYSVRRGDVFFTRTSETIDEIGMSSTCLETIPNATFAGFLIRFRPVPALDCRFSKHYFSNPRIRTFFAKEMVLITRASLSQDLLKRLPVLLPPASEQIAICDYLDERSAEFDTLTAEAQRAIDLLQERRTALISAAVTGQIDVRQQPKN